MILPAFGVTVADMEHLGEKGCVLVDTTCGSVLNVWKMVHRCARDGFTVVIHGKHYHEETRATASQALTHDGGHYLCVRDVAEAEIVRVHQGRSRRAQLMATAPAHAASPGFDPARDLERIGLANQTTMLMSESLEIQEMLRPAMLDRYGDGGAAQRFRAFDTICSATQDRQDAVLRMLDEGGLDVMVVIGGYNSSNTQALARMCAPCVPTFHIDSPASRSHPASPARGGAGGERSALAARGQRDGRDHCRRVDARQRRRRRRGADPRPARLYRRRSERPVSGGGARADLRIKWVKWARKSD